MKIFIFETQKDKKNLYPITYLSHISNLLCGIFTIKVKWELELSNIIHPISISHIEDYKSVSNDKKQLWINAIFLPDEQLIHSIKNLKMGECLSYKGVQIAFLINGSKAINKPINYPHHPSYIKRNYDFLTYNSKELKTDYTRLQAKHSPNDGLFNSTIINKEYVSWNKNVKIMCSTLDASLGPIYIDEGASIMPYTYIQGPAYIGINTQVRPHSTIRGSTSIGPYCTVGGEIKQSIIQGYSNKAHAGYMGNSIVGRWCNWGAGTTSSNTKNNFGDIKIYNQEEKKNISTGLKHLGVIMGDHCMCGINTTFNSGTIMGIGTTVHIHGFLPKYIPSFSWSKNKDTSIIFEEYQFDKLIKMVTNMMEDKQVNCSDKYQRSLEQVFIATRNERNQL